MIVEKCLSPCAQLTEPLSYMSKQSTSHVASILHDLSTTMPQTTLPNKDLTVDGQFSQVGVIKLSREEEILHKLGVLHLDKKATRARVCADETEATILQQAGVSYVNSKEFEESAETKGGKDMDGKSKMKTLSEKEAEILRNAGVTWLDDMTIVHDDVSSVHDGDTICHKESSVHDDDTICHKLGCETGTTAADTVGESTIGEATINSTYAERELLRRLKQGWSSTGEECQECGMPIICKSKGNTFECVICGVVDEEDNYNPDLEDSYNPDADVGESRSGVFDVGTSISTEPNEGFEDHNYDIMNHCHECQAPINGRDNQGIYCESCVKSSKEADDDDAYKEELGLRLFDGWELTKLSCPQCDLTLISQGVGTPSICLRCDDE